MARFSNTPSLARPGATNIQGTPAYTFEGGAGWAPSDPHVELFNAAVSGFLADGFYESGDQRVARIVDLVKQCDPAWLLGFAGWLRDTVNMRSASIVVAAEYARAGHTDSRKVIASALKRADEPGEMLGYWLSRYGRPIPSRVKRGIADAVQSLYNERSLLKWDGQGRGWRFGDVIEMTHPKPVADWQAALFKYALDRRRHPDEATPEALTLLRGVAAFTDTPEDQRRDALAGGLPDGFTWERLAGWLPGGMDAAAWEAVIPQMGAFALLRNLNNFDRAGISTDASDEVCDRITDPAEIQRARIMPFRFLTAYVALEADTYRLAIGSGAEAALANLPHLPGKTRIMVDCSGSMSDPVGAGKSRIPLSLSGLAGFMAEALARRCDDARIVCYSTQPQTEHRPLKHVSVVRAGAADVYRPNGGTYTWRCTEAVYRGDEDRVIVITDEQTSDRDNGVVQCPVITWNVAGYRSHHANHGAHNRHFVAGYNDSAIQVLPSVIKRADGVWPWQ